MYQHLAAEPTLSPNPEATVIPAPEPFPGLEAFLSRHKRLVGARALRILLSHPHQEIPASRLDEMLRQGSVDLPPASGEGFALVETPIPYSDRRAIREVKARLDYLLKLTTPADPARRREISALRGYLRDCQGPGGKLRNFESSSRKPYKRIWAAINCLLRHCQKEDPRLCLYLRKHLRSGREFCFSPPRSGITF